MMSIDMGGPFNKAAYVFGTASIASGNYDIMAAVMIGGMNMPLALSAVLMKDTMTTPDLIEMLIPEAREELKQFEITSEESDDDI